MKENLMSSRVDVVTVKSHPPVSHPIDEATVVDVVNVDAVTVDVNPMDVSTVDVVKQLSLTPQEPDQHSVDNC